MNHPHALAGRTYPLGIIGGEGFSGQERNVIRPDARTGKQQSQGHGDPRQAADRGALLGTGATLLQGHGGRQTIDSIHVRCGRLLNQAPGVRSDGSINRRCASAYKVSNAMDDLPELEIPVNTTMAFRGNEKETSRRLCVLAPWTVTPVLIS